MNCYAVVTCIFLFSSIFISIGEQRRWQKIVLPLLNVCLNEKAIKKPRKKATWHSFSSFFGFFFHNDSIPTTCHDFYGNNRNEWTYTQEIHMKKLIDIHFCVMVNIFFLCYVFYIFHVFHVVKGTVAFFPFLFAFSFLFHFFSLFIAMLFLLYHTFCVVPLIFPVTHILPCGSRRHFL